MVNKQLILIAAFLGVAVFTFSTVAKAAPYKIYITKAITNTRILPDTWPLPGFPDNTIRIQACRGQYASATFTLHAFQDLQDVGITTTDLYGGNHARLSGAVDIRVVKCWFQAGVLWNQNNQCLLIPELLLKDDKLVKVDLPGKKNYLRASSLSEPENYVLISGKDPHDLRNIAPKDADSLQPVDIPAHTNKQFWITVHLRDDVTPGNYQGKIILRPANAPSRQLVFSLQILPFVLEKPILRYSMWYRGKLTRHSLEYLPELQKLPIINTDFKSPEQYFAEMQDLEAHGVYYPTISQQDDKLYRKELNIRQKAGLPTRFAFTACISMRGLKTESQLNAFKEKAEKWLKMTKKYGYEEIYFFGIDEAGRDLLKSQRPAWNRLHQIGGKVFTTINQGDFAVAGDLLDLAVIPNRPDPQEARKYHQLGQLVFNYGYPQSGSEDPVIYRRKYGLALWKGQYDGAMDYAYQHCVDGHIWNDFNHPRSRPLVLAYPTINGVIDTIQWEGFRQGVNDVRYLTTLMKVIKQAKQKKPELAAEAQAWVENLNPNDDLDTLRLQMIAWILKLK